MKLKIVIFLLIIVTTFFYVQGIDRANESEEAVNAESAIQKAAITCYALEGSYPPLEYLVAHYGIQLNSDKFYYHYEMIGSNILPIIKVLRK